MSSQVETARSRASRYLAITANRWFVVAVAAVVLLHLAVALIGIYVAPLGFDEAYVAQSPWNLVAGHGYSTLNCCGEGISYSVFDSLTSTGPVVLLPIAASFALFGVGIVQLRWTMVIFYALLVAVSFVLGKRIGNRWIGLAAAVSVLALNLRIDFPRTVTWSMTDGLGELPAAAFLLLAFVLLPRNKYWAALAVGAAALCKLIVLVAVPALVIAVLLLTPVVGHSGRAWFARIKAVVVCGIIVAAPSVLWEIVKLISLGWEAYPTALKGYLSFIINSGSGISHQGDAGDIPTRIAWVGDGWFIPWPLALAVLVIGLVLAVVAIRQAKRSDDTTHWIETRTIAIAAGGTILMFLIWWIVISTSFFLRHLFPGLFLIPPVLTAFAGAGLVHLLRSTSSRRAVKTTAWVVLVGWIGIAGWQMGNHLVQSVGSPAYSRADQVEVANLIAERFPDGVQHVAYFMNPEIQLLNQVPSYNYNFPVGTGPLVLSPQMEDILPSVYEHARSLCIDVVYEKNGFVVCTVDMDNPQDLGWNG